MLSFPIVLSTMDIIDQCLSLAPVPFLSPVFCVLRSIWASVERVHTSKQQLKALAQSIAQLLETLNKQYNAGELQQVGTSSSLDNLRRFVTLALPWIFGAHHQRYIQIT